MSTKSTEEVPEVTYENIISFIRSHEDPCVTAGEISAEFGITGQAANYRLQKLRDAGEVREKDAGASAKVWYVTG